MASMDSVTQVSAGELRPAATSPAGEARRRNVLALRAAGALIAVLALIAAEIVVVGVVHRDLLLSAAELRVALSRLLPIAFLLAAPLAVVGTGVLALVDSPRRASSVVLGAAAAMAGALVAFGVSGGRHLREPPVRIGFVLAVAALAFAVAWALRRPIAALRRRSVPAFLLLVLLAVIGCQAANVLVLPRLYPAFHLGLSALALVLGSWLGEALLALRADRALVGAAGVALLASGGFARTAANSLRSWDNVRMVFLEYAPWTSKAVLAAATIARSDSPEPAAAPAPAHSAEQAPGRRWLDWTGRDVLLVTVDALRADHVGAYGYGRPTTPEIDKLASEGVVFEHAYCPMPHTSYSVTSLMTGKYMRPLLLQGMGEDSETIAGVLRLYGYQTAAFYPPAVFTIDAERFRWVEARGLDFAYRKVEYTSAEKRLEQVTQYLAGASASQRLMLWVHFFEPHEPYELHPQHDFGERDIDRYDSEIAAADAVVGRLIRTVRQQRPNTVVILSSDHGEEFGEHGGYYHGTSVHEEQVRVPLIMAAEGVSHRRVQQPAQLIDVVPTILHALNVPRSPRLRGNDLGPWLVGEGTGEGMAFSESNEHTMLAADRHRLICQRRVDACALYDVLDDPGQKKNISAPQVERFNAMRARLRELASSHGQFEQAGVRAEGRPLPAALRRGMLGDADAAQETASLLDDADVVIRRAAAQVLFGLRQTETSPALRLALARDEDQQVRRWSALALTRMGQGAPLALELLADRDPEWHRLAALAFAEAGDARGEAILVAWWESGVTPFELAKEVIAALGRIKASSAVVPLSKSLRDVRLRPYLAEALAQIGDPYGRIALLGSFTDERYETSRRAIAEALVLLGASREMAPPLARFLGVPDPLPEGLDIALRAKITGAVGGPEGKALAALSRAGDEGLALQVVVPAGGNKKGSRIIVRGRPRAAGARELRVGAELPGAFASKQASSPALLLDPACVVSLRFSAEGWAEQHVRLPDCMRAESGKPLRLIVVPARDLELAALAVVPLADEIPPPAPEPWTPEPSEQKP
jgi:arylsulfatase A-like enzyme